MLREGRQIASRWVKKRILRTDSVACNWFEEDQAGGGPLTTGSKPRDACRYPRRDGEKEKAELAVHGVSTVEMRGSEAVVVVG